MSRNPRRARRRKSKQRSVKRRVLIVCEGRETERNYFDRLKRRDEVDALFTVTVKRSKGGSRTHIAQSAIDCKQITEQKDGKFDECWCVMDVEQESEHDAVRAAVRLLRDNGFRVCLSNPAFEVWLLAHFVKTSRSFADCDAVVRGLNPKWKTRFGRDYDKSDGRAVAGLVPDAPKAIRNAKAVRESEFGEQSDTCLCNSSTEVYRLVETLWPQKEA